ncbi:MAG: hypothetical protein R3B06_18995 [Kofleriaceae bacterium]
MRRPCSALLALAAAAAAARANPAESPAADGAVFAGVTGASTSNVTSNPATLMRLVPGVHFFAGSTVSVDQLTIARRTVDPDTGALGPGPTVRGTTTGVGLTVGVATTSSRGMFAVTAALRPPDETLADPALAYHTRGSRTRRIDWATLSGGFALTSRLYLGLAGTLADRAQVVAFARDTALAAGHDPLRGVGSDCGGAPCGLEDPAATELWSVTATPSSLVTIDNLMYTVGLMARLPGGVWVGLATERPWRVGDFRMVGTATVVAAPRDGGATHTGEAVVIQRLPEVIRLGARGPLGRALELTAEARWRRIERTSAVDLRVFGGDVREADVPEATVRPRGLQDAVAVEVGLEQAPLDRAHPERRWRFGGRLGFDSGAVAADRLSARAPWGAQLSAAVGTEVKLASWTLQLGYRFDLGLPGTAAPGAYDPTAGLACVDSSFDFDLPACATLRAGYGTSTAAGDYSRLSHTARLTAEYLLP